MTTSEIAFLALGLVLGAAIGAALAQALRDRPAPRREVRLTITPNAIPAGRTRTLAARDGSAQPDAFPGSPEAVALADAQHGPAGAAPADEPTLQGVQLRTRVPSGPVTLPPTAVGVPVRGERSGAPVAAPDGAPAASAAGLAPSDAARTAAGAPAPAGSNEDGDSAPAPGPSAVLLVAPQPAGRGTGPTAGESPRPSAVIGTTVSRAPSIAVVPTPGAAAGVAVLEAPRLGLVAPAAPRDARPAADDGFTSLVRPRPPVDSPRPTLGLRAVPIAIPPARLAPPSAPTLTLPRAAVATIPARPSPASNGFARRVPPRPRAEAARGELPGPAGAPDGAAARPDLAADPCSGPRRMVDERCALAAVARDQAKGALDALREAQRTYDVLRDHVDRAETVADPRRVAAEKDRLHAAFRAAADRAGGTDETEAAARAWLDEINALNAAVREAQRIVDAGAAELRASHPALVRLSAEADAARIAAENAEAGCREARQELSECEEAETRARQAPPPPAVEPHPFAAAWPVDRPDLPDGDREQAPDRLGGYPLIVRILRGDRDARERLVATLATGEPDTARDWQLRISRLVDAIAGRAIEDGYLDTPDDHPFWRLFERREARDIVGALSALGFRYDGLGGFADGRVPAARDLSLAVGYAGLDRMRIRTWPREAEIVALYDQVVVAADEWLSDQAGDLSLGRMVDALGGRAAELADLWNAWGRVRPVLLAP